MDDNEKSLLNICLRRYCLLLRDKYLKNESESKKKSYRDQFPLDFIHMVHKTARKMHIIDDNFVTFIIPSIRDLSELIIPKCKITSIGLIKIIEECKLLKKVDLSFCENISDTGFKNIIELKELVYLNVESTQIEGSTLVTYKDLTKLKYLNIKQCKNIENSDVIEFLKAVDDIEVFECDQLQTYSDFSSSSSLDSDFIFDGDYFESSDEWPI